jgi:hypothetical protein
MMAVVSVLGFVEGFLSFFEFLSGMLDKLLESLLLFSMGMTDFLFVLFDSLFVFLNDFSVFLNSIRLSNLGQLLRSSLGGAGEAE